MAVVQFQDWRCDSGCKIGNGSGKVPELDKCDSGFKNWYNSGKVSVLADVMVDSRMDMALVKLQD